MFGKTPRTSPHPNPEIDQSDGNFNPYEIDPDASLLVETTDEENVRLDPNQFQFQQELEVGELMAVWVEGYTNLRGTSVPTHLHIPVNTKTASENLHEKSEGRAYVRTEIIRYSTVINPSNSPDVTVDLNAPYLELWFDEIEP